MSISSEQSTDARMPEAEHRLPWRVPCSTDRPLSPGDGQAGAAQQPAAVDADQRVVLVPADRVPRGRVVRVVDVMGLHVHDRLRVSVDRHERVGHRMLGGIESGPIQRPILPIDPGGVAVHSLRDVELASVSIAKV